MSSSDYDFGPEQKNPGTKRTGIIVLLVVLMLLGGGAGFVFGYVIPGLRYSEGGDLLAQGKYEEAAEAFRSAGDYKDASQRVAEVEAAQRLAQLQGHYADGEKAFTAGDFDKAAEHFKLAEEYSDAAQRAEESLHAFDYTQGQVLFAAEDYAAAAEKFTAAKDYSDASEMVHECHYLLAQAHMKAGKYADAISEFETAGEYKDAVSKAGEAHYKQAESMLKAGRPKDAAKEFQAAGSYSDASSRIMKLGKSLISEKKYKEAVDVLQLSSSKDAPRYISYVNGLVAYGKKDYKTAMTEFTAAGKLEDAPAKLKAATYQQGIKLLGSKKFGDARKLFKKISGYKKSKHLINVCTAEIALSNGRFNAALKAYEAVPKSLKVTGFNAAKRRALVMKYKSFASICGEWKATKNYIESRSTHITTGIWNNWYIDKTDSSQRLTIHCYLQNNGKMRVEGRVTYLRFNNYSILSAYCKAYWSYDSFTLKNLKKVPSKIKIDSHTKIKRVSKKFNFTYKYTENENVYFRYRYKTTITYGKRVKKF